MKDEHADVSREKRSGSQSSYDNKLRAGAEPNRPSEKGAIRLLHIIASNAKSFLLGTFHGIGEKHLQRYLDEFCYRFNRRKREPKIFERLLHACLSSRGLTYSELTG